MTPWFLYLIRTADNKLYTGITTDVERRYQQHQSGKGAKALRGKGELTLVFSAPVGDRSLALRAEYRVKQLTKRQKERLVAEGAGGNDSNLLIVFYVQIMPDDFVMQLHRF
ncbi:GIY-YIG nuclease family protein [Escherichia coli]|uniref:GIY-YIG nuclease family protein n=4 Tax=Enterobacteriaceae TaxID=543 RepID=UPI0020366951|nr:GIY-YIG nuclease family protein [Escherichia coli]